MFALAVLLLGAVALERAALLPEPAATALRRVEAWLEPVLRDLGIERPPASTPGAEPAPGAPGDPAAVAQALTLLDRIPVAPERRRGYDRSDWPHWLDVDGDCLDTRDEVLAAESLERMTLDAEGCNLVAGLWLDAYTGQTTRDPGRLDVDHVVPLAEAWRSGGHAWSAERRAAYANDLGDPRTLAAVSASANRSKGDQGPEEWLPPERDTRCGYVAGWVAIKARWQLSMDERERIAVGNLLRACARS